nr:PAS domain S-box protein [Sagittula marina]
MINERGEHARLQGGPVTTFDTVELAFELSPVAMLLVNSNGKICLTNRELDKLFGYDDGALIGRVIETLIPEGMREEHVVLRDAFAVLPAKRRMGVDRVINGLTATKTVLPIELGLEPVCLEDEAMVIVTALDLRARMAGKARIGAILDAASCAMLVVNGEGRIEFVNRAVTELLGYTPQELLGETVEMLVPPHLHSAHQVYRRSFASLADQRAMAPGRTVCGWHRDGYEVPVEGSLNQIEVDGARSVVVTLVDLSERIATEKLMAERARELERLNSDLEQFNRCVSHDLKAPLSSIAGLLSLCREDLVDGSFDDLDSTLTRAQAIAERSIGDIEELLRVALTAERGIQSAQVEVAALVTQLWEDLGGRPEELTLTLAHRVPFDTEVATFRSILRNLLSNALRYRDPSKPALQVEVSARQDNTFVDFLVTDNGLGIPEDFLPEVFGLFKRLGDQGGSGIGLNLVQRNVERLGGEITVTSVLGEGATFKVRLPVVREQET